MCLCFFHVVGCVPKRSLLVETFCSFTSECYLSSDFWAAKKCGERLSRSMDPPDICFCVTGSFQVVDSTTLEDIVGFHHRKEEISDIKFSPGKPK